MTWISRHFTPSSATALLTLLAAVAFFLVGANIDGEIPINPARTWRVAVWNWDLKIDNYPEVLAAAEIYSQADRLWFWAPDRYPKPLPVSTPKHGFSINLGWPVLALLLISFACYFHHCRNQRLHPTRRSDKLCPHCGYDLRATPSHCPECGAGYK